MSKQVLHVGLMDVRAADSIRIRFDFERDGWAVYMGYCVKDDLGTQPCDAEGDPVDDEIMQEVAFVPAWNEWKPEETVK